MNLFLYKLLISVRVRRFIYFSFSHSANSLLCFVGPPGSNTPPVAIKSFFQDIDWDALYNRQVEMPYIPDLKGNTCFN